ncbi:MAG: sugar phosphate isomerase/epimerase family protein [Flavisolibacter sp.]
MEHSNRRKFLKTATGLIGYAVFPFSIIHSKNEPLLSFSTLGCPDWTFETIVNFAAKNGYTGIELRGIKRELDLTKCPEFKPENIASTLRLMQSKGLRFVDLGSSATLHYSNEKDRQKNLDDGKRFIDLAEQVKCPFIRVFPNNFPKDQEKKATMELITSGLLELANYAKDSNVKVLLETHGDLIWSDDIKTVIEAANHPHAGLVWDSINMWSVTKEPPGLVYDKLKKYIYHTHIKDLKFTGDKFQYTLLGKGESPIFEAIDSLRKGGYKGYYSFEWEKLWHPEIEEPEIALADYPVVMKEHFKRQV